MQNFTRNFLENTVIFGIFASLSSKDLQFLPKWVFGLNFGVNFGRKVRRWYSRERALDSVSIFVLFGLYFRHGVSDRRARAAVCKPVFWSWWLASTRSQTQLFSSKFAGSTQLSPDWHKQSSSHAVSQNLPANFSPLIADVPSHFALCRYSVERTE
jgi:hypothetical protein